MDFENRSVDERLRANMTKPGAAGAIGDRSDQQPVLPELVSEGILAGNFEKNRLPRHLRLSNNRLCLLSLLAQACEWPFLNSEFRGAYHVGTLPQSTAGSCTSVS